LFLQVVALKVGQPRRLFPQEPYLMRFLLVQNICFFVYLNSRNEAILKKLSDSLATTDLN